MVRCARLVRCGENKSDNATGGYGGMIDMEIIAARNGLFDVRQELRQLYLTGACLWHE